MDAIYKFMPLLVENGVMQYDHYNVAPGVRKAVDETFGEMPFI
jgi:hypothetical protein